MAVIRCKNCENEILDTEIVCPYCDCPVAGGTSSYSTGKDDAAMAGETVKIATSKDFEKEKDAFLNSFENDLRSGYEDTSSTEEPVQETVKIPQREITYNSSKTRSASAYQGARRGAARSSYYQKQEKRRKRNKAILAVTISVIAIVFLVYIISFFASCGSGGNDQNTETKTHKSDNVVKDLGYEYDEASYTLIIIDSSCIGDYNESDEKPWDSAGTVRHLIISDDITRIGEYAFAGMTMEDVTIPASISHINSSAFYGCENLKKIKFDKKISELYIGEYAFAKCSSLESLTFPETVKQIGAGAFKECTNLEYVEVLGKNTSVGEKAFFGCSDDLVIACLKESRARVFAEDNDYEIDLLDGDESDEEDETDVESDDDENKDDKTDDKKDDKKDNKKDDKKDVNGSKPSTTDDKKDNSTVTPSENKTENQENTQPAQPSGETNTEKTKEQKMNEIYDKMDKAQTQEEIDGLYEELDKIVNS